jgi:arsenate reductase
MKPSGVRSKSWDEFTAPGAQRIDFVFTVCDSAAAETCPVWPGKPVTVHWGVEDPAAVTGSEEQRRAAFRHAAEILKRRIERLVELPIETREASALRSKLQEIGGQ